MTRQIQIIVFNFLFSYFNTTGGNTNSPYGVQPSMPPQHLGSFGANVQQPPTSFHQPANNAPQTPAFFTPPVPSQPQAPMGFPSQSQAPTSYPSQPQGPPSMANNYNIMNPSTPPAHGMLFIILNFLKTHMTSRPVLLCNLNTEHFPFIKGNSEIDL